MPESLLARGVETLGRAAAWLFAAAVVVTVYEVVARYAFGAPTSWAHETVTAMCAVAFVLGGAYAQRRDEHMRVTSLVDRMPPAWQDAGRWLSIGCGTVCLAGLAWGCGSLALESVWRFEMRDGANVWVPEPLPGPPGWPLPALVKAMLFAGTVLFLAVLLASARRRGPR